MSDDILHLILQAEKEYHDAVKNAAAEAENYAEECKLRQNADMERLNEEWQSFEEAANEKFQKSLSEDEKKMEAETAQKKEHLRIRQKEKIDAISERLKEEVLSLYGDRKDGKTGPDFQGGAS